MSVCWDVFNDLPTQRGSVTLSDATKTCYVLGFCLFSPSPGMPYWSDSPEMMLDILFFASETENLNSIIRHEMY